jgi:hypothetical protein
MNNWQPIATAPRDGTLILIWDGDRHQIIRADDLTQGPDWLKHACYALRPVHRGVANRWPVADPTYRSWSATHWIPLPTPPGSPGHD